MGKITKDKAITIYARASKIFNQKGNDGEWLDIESWRLDDPTGKVHPNSGAHLFTDDPYEFPFPDKGPHLTEPSYDNPLHKFASYNTLFTLSGLGKDELADLSYLKETYSPHEIIARSGGIGDDPKVNVDKFKKEQADYYHRVKHGYKFNEKYAEKWDQEPSVNILAKGHDIFFEDVNILSTVGPNPERGLSNFTKMEFQLHEPFGVTFVEKIRAACFINDFDDYQDAPLLLTIQWKGWDEHGKDKSVLGSTALTRKIPILISRVQFDVTEGGAKYQCIAVPYSDMAFDDRFKFPRTTLNISASHMYGTTTRYHSAGRIGKKTQKVVDESGWIYKMEAALKTQMDDEIKEKVRQEPDTYKFVVHNKVAKFGKEFLRELHLEHYEQHMGIMRKLGKMLTGAPKIPEVKIDLAEASVDMNTALPKFFEDAIRTLYGYQMLAERFWYTWGNMQLQKRGSSTTKPGTSTTKPGSNTPVSTAEKIVEYYQDNKRFAEDLEKNQYIDWFMIKPSVYTNTDKFDHIRKVHPKEITYYAIPTKIHILKFVKAGVAFPNINWDDHVKKQYDYIYTGDNIDVQELKIDYKTAYYQRNVRPYWKTTTNTGKYDQFKKSFTETFQGVFAKGKVFPEPALPLRQEPSHIRGYSTVSSTSPRTHKAQEFYDYITNPQVDMMRIELTILGDPQFICHDVYTPLKREEDGSVHPSGSAGIYNSAWGSFNAEQYQPLVKVNYRLPDEISEKTEGLMFEKQVSYSENLFFNGVYQVTKVESRFDQGQFTQVLSLVRLNNQKGGDTAIAVSFGGDFKEYFEDKAEKEKNDLIAKERLNEMDDIMNEGMNIKEQMKKYWENKQE
jgi:hypothetical protein